MKQSALFLAFALAAPFAANAADLSYSYIEAGYAQIDPRGVGDADGFTVGGSAALGGQFHVYGSYTDVDLDFSRNSIRPWRLGLGWNTSIGNSSDLVVRANYLDYAGSSLDVDGWESEVGLRSAFGDRVETYVALGYGEIGGKAFRTDGDFYGKLGAQYKFNPAWGIAFTATLSDNADEYFLGPRISF